MKKILIKILKYSMLFIIIICIFNISLYFACLFDSNILKKNIEKSSKILKTEGYRYKLSNVFNVKSDTYTDALIINEAYSVDNKVPYLSYMKMRKNYRSGITSFEVLEKVGEGFTINYNEFENKEILSSDTIGELENFLDGKIHYSTIYARYWHGYMVIYRPLLILFNILQIRFILFILHLILFVYFLYLIYREFGKNISIIFALSLVCSGYFSASYSLSNSPVFLTMMISSIYLLKRIDKLDDFSLYIFIVGCITSFIDFLTVPLITLGIPSVIYLLKMYNNNRDWKYCTKFLIKNSIVWLIGFILTWFFKWLQYDLTIDDSNNMLNIGFSQILFRTQRVNEAWGIDINYISVIYEIISRSTLYILLSVIIITFVNKFKFVFNEINKNLIPIFLLALYPIMWYIILANHTIMHDFYTYRNSLIFMLCILLCIYELFYKKEVVNEKIR